MSGKASAAPTLAPPQIQDAVERIEREAQSLSSEEHRHLQSHVAVPPQVAASWENAEKRYQRIVITVNNLRANSKALLSLRHDRDARWSAGQEADGLVGLSLSTSRDPAIYMRNFLINPRELYVQTYKDSQDVQIGLYVHTGATLIQGRADLPPGASVTFQSTRDRTTVIGLSAFALELE